MIRIMILIILFIGLSGCSSLQSIKNPNQEANHGLHYFMPKKDFLVTVTITDEKISKVKLATTPAYPDIATPYLLSYDANAFGKNILYIGVDQKGLLTSVNSTTISEVTQALQNLAVPTNGKERDGIEAKAYDSSESTTPAKEGCSNEGEHTFIYKTVGEHSACGLHINIKKYGDSGNITSHSIKENQAISGIFYRQNLPYLITAQGQGIKAAAIVFSPSESKTHFIPVSKTFFANNGANFGFTEGVLTQYRQATSGELTALLTLPAEIIKAYFSAVGTVFPSFSSVQNPQQITDYRPPQPPPAK